MSESEPNKKSTQSTAATPSDTGIMKDRSVAACLSNAFDLYCSNFATIFRHSWLPALVFSMIGATGIMPELITPSPLLSAAVSACSILGIVAAGAWFDSSYITLFNGMTRRETMKRALCNRLMGLACEFAAFLAILIASAAIYAIALGQGDSKAQIAFISTAMMPTVAIVIVVMLCAILPLIYSTTSYITDAGTTMRMVFTSLYKRGWSNWGYLFGVTALTMLVLMVVFTILAVPLIVLMAAIIINRDGIALGDTDAMPPYTGVLLYAATSVVLFVFSYASVWTFLTFFHAYGAIESRTKERAESKDING